MIFQFTAVGTCHKYKDIINQDALAAIDNEQYSIIALADGVSSCARAREGAQEACRAVTELLESNPEYFMQTTEKLRSQVVIEHVMNALSKLAGDSDPVSLSSTLSFALLDKCKGKVLLFQLGDGLVVGCQDYRVCCLIQPDRDTNGICVTTTHGAAERCYSRICDCKKGDAFMLMSDGAWHSFVEHGKLQPLIADAFSCGNYDHLVQVLQISAAKDDNSFIIVTVE